MIVVIGGDLLITYVNQRLLDIMGYRREDVLGTNIFDYVHPDDHDFMATAWAGRAADPGATGLLIEARGRNADGSWRAVEILGLSLLDDERVGGMVMSLRDLGRKAEVGPGPTRLRSMIDRTTDVVLLLDREGRIGYANRRLIARYGLDHELGVPFTTLLPAADHARFDEWFAALVADGDRTDARIRLGLGVPGAVADGPPTLEWHGTNQLDDPLIEGVILSGRDVTELAEMERRLAAQTEQLRHNAGHDSLTGLLNRRAFLDQMAEVIAERRDRDDGGDVVVLFCDLDRLKHVNDTYGHARGDQVLRVSADRLSACLTDRDLVARWGGDEFAVMLDGSPSDAAVDELVGRLRFRLGTPITGGDVTTVVGVTVGVSRAAVAKADVDDLLHRADEAMYTIKRTR